MKNSMKKKALVSSVAMLSVATLALGSATYAWFTNNREVVADGMKVKAASAQGLQITNNNGANWGSHAQFTDSNVILNPISLGYDATTAKKLTTTEGYYPGNAAHDGPANAANDYANYTQWTALSIPQTATSGLGVGADTGDFKAFRAYEVGVRSSTGTIADAINFTLTYTPTNQADIDNEYIRVALLDCGTADAAQANYTESLVGVVGHENSSAVTAIDTATDTITEANQVGTIIDKTNVANVGNTRQISGTITAGTLSTTPHWYTILVWFEGQDSNCTDDHLALEGSIDIDFQY